LAGAFAIVVRRFIAVGFDLPSPKALFRLLPFLPSRGTEHVICASTPLSLRRRECDRIADDLNHRMEAPMGDKSPKSKEREQKQKNAAKAESTAEARSKQDSQNRATQVPGKAKK
jgi:hypothetical protein